MAATELKPAGRDRLRLGIILGALTAFGPLSVDMYLPALPALTRDLGSTASEVQLTLSGCLVGLALGQVIAGPLSDALGRKRPLVLGVAAYAVVSLACAAAPSVPALIVLRVLQGVAGGAGVVIARAMVGDLHAGAAAARYLSVLMLVNGVAPILGPVLGGQVLEFASWRAIFVVLAGVGAALFLAAALGLPETLAVERRRSLGLAHMLATMRDLLRDRVFTGYAAASGLAFGSAFAYVSGSAYVLQSVYDISAQTYGLLFGVNAAGLIAASQLNRALLRRFSVQRLLAVGIRVSAGGGVALLIVVATGAAGLAGVAPALFVIVASLGFIVPNAVALALGRHPEAAGTASALLGVIQYAAAALLAPLVGVAGVHTALPMAIIIAALSAAALTVITTVTRAERRLAT